MSGRTLLRNFGGYSTPEYPNGTYAYFVTIDASAAPVPTGPPKRVTPPLLTKRLNAPFTLPLNTPPTGHGWDGEGGMGSGMGRGPCLCLQHGCSRRREARWRSNFPTMR